MSKEWLEDWLKDKKEQLKSATVFINENGNEAVEVSLSVLNKLFEQAERVNELEQQNKRYREALKFYADDKSWEFDWLYDIRESLIWQDYGEKARKALEGEE